MPKRKFSLLIVDENREVRECLGDLFRGSGFEIGLAENHDNALRDLPADLSEKGPDAIILGHAAPADPERFLSSLQSLRPETSERVALIVFPSFRVSIATSQNEAQRPVPACRLSAVSNLMSVVQGLARRYDHAVGAP
jgi:hypothetical protein